MDKEDVAYIYIYVYIYIRIYTHTHTHTHTVEYYSAIKRNETGSFVEMWMSLESVLQSEVSKPEAEKQILYINTLYVESRKMVHISSFNE